MAALITGSSGVIGVHFPSATEPIKHRLYHISSGRSYKLKELGAEMNKLIPSAEIAIDPGMLNDVLSIKASIPGPFRHQKSEDTSRIRIELQS